MSALARITRLFRPAGVRLASAAAAQQPTPAAAQPAAPAAPAAAQPIPSMEELRAQAKKLYKDLHRLGRDYPDADYNFNMRLRRAFEKNATLTDPAELKRRLDLAAHIKKEILAMYSLKKYRHLRRAYHANEPPRAISDHFAQVDTKDPLAAANSLPAAPKA